MKEIPMARGERREGEVMLNWVPFLDWRKERRTVVTPIVLTTVKLSNAYNPDPPITPEK